MHLNGTELDSPKGLTLCLLNSFACSRVYSVEKVNMSFGGGVDPELTALSTLTVGPCRAGSSSFDMHET